MQNNKFWTRFVTPTVASPRIELRSRVVKPSRAVKRFYGAGILVKCGFLPVVLAAMGWSAEAKADGPLAPVHLKVGGREVMCKTTPLADNDETYIPLEALSAIGMEGKADKKGETAHINMPLAHKQGDIAFARPNNKSMLALSEVAKLANAVIVRAEKMGRDNKPIPGSKGDTVYLLARVTDARLQNNVLRVTTSFPVPYKACMITDEKPLRGYIDCVGADVDEKFQPVASSSAGNDRLMPKVRAAQYSIDTARIVAELPDGMRVKEQEGTANHSLTIAAELTTGKTLVAQNSKANGRGSNSKANPKSGQAAIASGQKSGDKTAANSGSPLPSPGGSGDQGDTQPVQTPGGIGGDKSDKTVKNGADNSATDPSGQSGGNTTPPKKPTVAAAPPVRPSIRGKSPSRGGSPNRNVPVEVRGWRLCRMGIPAFISTSL